MVYLFLADGFEEVEALCPVDLLRRADIEVKTVGIGKKTATGSHGITVECDMQDSEIDYGQDFEMVILPGGMPGTVNLDKSEAVHKLLDIAEKEERLIGAICAAPIIPGKRGMLRGKRAVCYPGYEEQLKGADILYDEGAIRDGNIITGRAMGTSHEFSLMIIEALRGKEMRRLVEDSVLYRKG
ncbi:MAG: DJ-1/PfpI family protein [Clostridia bacterium]|nr:DJ-1/PfpI family protein [Clostridia bacterium]